MQRLLTFSTLPTKDVAIYVFLYFWNAGYFGREVPDVESADAVNSSINRDADPEIFDLLLKEVNADKIRENLK